MARFKIVGALALMALCSGAQAREITHAMGVTDVPDAPQRVVVLANDGAEALAFLGIVPVGAAQSWYGDPWYDFIAEGMGDATPLGTETALDLELIAALEPDLIIGTKVRQEKLYDQLSAIAPTVMSETIGGVWKDNFRLYGEAVGMGEDAEAAIAMFDGRVAAFQRALGDQLKEEISLVRFSPGRTRIFYQNTFAGKVLEEIGFSRPATQRKDAVGEEVTKERIPEMDGDRLFYFVDDDTESQAWLADWTGDALWQTLSVVQNQRASRADNLIWNASNGFISANRLLDDLATTYEVDLPEMDR